MKCATITRRVEIERLRFYQYRLSRRCGFYLDRKSSIQVINSRRKTESRKNRLPLGEYCLPGRIMVFDQRFFCALKILRIANR